MRTENQGYKDGVFAARLRGHPLARILVWSSPRQDATNQLVETKAHRRSTTQAQDVMANHGGQGQHRRIRESARNPANPSVALPRGHLKERTVMITMRRP